MRLKHSKCVTALCFFLRFPGFNKKESALETDEDKWLFCLKHMGNLKDIPVSFEKDPIFKKLFDIAEFSNLTPAEMNAYQRSLKIQRDNYVHDQNVLRKGEVKSRHDEAMEIARELKKEGLAIDFISKTTKLTIEEIEKL